MNKTELKCNEIKRKNPPEKFESKYFTVNQIIDQINQQIAYSSKPASQKRPWGPSTGYVNKLKNQINMIEANSHLDIKELENLMIENGILHPYNRLKKEPRY